MSDDGKPQPATAPMSKEEAFAVAGRSHNQLVPFLHDDGKWYCFERREDPLTITPKVPVDNDE